MEEPVEVTVDLHAPQEEMDALVTVFADVGIEAEVKDGYLRMSVGVLPYAVFVLAQLKWIATAFAVGASGKAGADSWDAYKDGGWEGLKVFIQRVARARRNDPAGHITIRDPTGPDIDLHEGIPDEALRELAELDWPAMKSGRLSWRGDGGGWIYLGGDRAKLAPRRSDRKDPAQ
jgi:hypothetical protein